MTSASGYLVSKCIEGARPLGSIIPRLYSVYMKPRWLPVRIVARSHRTYGKNRGTVNSLGVRCKTQCTVVAYSSGFDTLEWWYSYTFQTHSLAELQNRHFLWTLVSWLIYISCWIPLCTSIYVKCHKSLHWMKLELYEFRHKTVLKMKTFNW